MRLVWTILFRFVLNPTVWGACGLWIGLQYGKAIGYQQGNVAMFQAIEMLREAQKPPPPFQKGEI